MENCQCQGLERETKQWVLEDLALYRRGKPAKTTPMLIGTLVNMGVEGLTLLEGRRGRPRGDARCAKAT